jgi:hypothetical protein
MRRKVNGLAGERSGPINHVRATLSVSHDHATVHREAARQEGLSLLAIIHARHLRRDNSQRSRLIHRLFSANAQFFEQTRRGINLIHKPQHVTDVHANGAIIVSVIHPV